MAEQNYFTCTLEYAESRKRQGLESAPFENILQLIEEQAESIPNLEAIGFAGSEFHDKIGKGNAIRVLVVTLIADIGIPVLTYRDLKALSISAAQLLYHQVGTPSKTSNSTVGLLCQSSIEFILAWLGLLRLGWSTLFIR